MLAIPELRRQRQMTLRDFEASLIYIENSRPRAIGGYPVSRGRGVGGPSKRRQDKTFAHGLCCWGAIMVMLLYLTPPCFRVAQLCQLSLEKKYSVLI